MVTNADLITYPFECDCIRVSCIQQKKSNHGHKSYVHGLTDKEMINKSKFGNLTHQLQNAFAVTSGKRVMANDAVFFC